MLKCRCQQRQQLYFFILINSFRFLGVSRAAVGGRDHERLLRARQLHKHASVITFES